MAHAGKLPLVDQVAPPSVVAAMPPPSCARQVIVVGQLILLKPFWNTFGFNCTQVLPPSVVFNAVAQSPTA
jgi:hypothetical protein